VTYTPKTVDGSEFASYEDANSGVTASMAAGEGSAGEAERDTYTNIKGLIGSAFDDHLIGDDAVNTLQGGAGADTLEGGAGADSLDGGDGIDFASYANATEGVTASLFKYVASSGEAEGDSYTSIEGLIGSSHNDLLVGDFNDNTLEGGAGADALEGNDGNDFASHANATEGVTASLATPLDNTGEAEGDVYYNIDGLIGSAFDDHLIGDDAVNTLQGGAGEDTLEGGASADSLYGGEGIDFASYANASEGITASLANPPDNTREAEGDSYIDIEGLIGSAHADRLIGDSNDNILEGGAGDDSLDGGEGTDFASYQNATGGVTASLATPSDNTGEAEGDTYTNIEGLIGSAHADELAGDARANILRGGKGADVLIGNKGDDTLEGGAGADSLYGGDGIDFASYANAAGGVTASLGNPAQSFGADAEGDTYTSIEGLIGSAHADWLIGDGAANTLQGAAGSDTLTGGAGADSLDGGEGNDFASYQNATEGVTASLATPWDNTGEAVGDAYTDIEGLIGSALNDFLIGNDAANILQGGNGTDALDGGRGDDTLEGGKGDDIIGGGEGNKTFIWRIGDGNDAIYLPESSNTLDLEGWAGGPVTDKTTSGDWSVAIADDTATFRPCATP